jgi:hypothetical protein
MALAIQASAIRASLSIAVGVGAWNIICQGISIGGYTGTCIAPVRRAGEASGRHPRVGIEPVATAVVVPRSETRSGTCWDDPHPTPIPRRSAGEEKGVRISLQAVRADEKGSTR